MSTLRFVLAALGLIATLALAFACVTARWNAKASTGPGRPTGDYCSKDGEYMIYRRLIKTPDRAPIDMRPGIGEEK